MSSGTIALLEMLLVLGLVLGLAARELVSLKRHERRQRDGRGGSQPDRGKL